LVVVVVWWRWEVEAGERGRGVSQKDRQRKEVLGELEREERERDREGRTGRGRTGWNDKRIKDQRRGRRTR